MYILKQSNKESGFVLIATLMLLGLLLALLGVYYVTTSSENATVRFSRGSASGFFAAEAGLNLRAEDIREIFVGYNRPAGVSPASANPCKGSNIGSGNYVCQAYDFNNRNVKTWVAEDSSNPLILTIPPGERYEKLSAQEYRYTAKSQAVNNTGMNEADLELRFKSRLVPLFQFAAFYNKDLEILPGPTMTLTGPVHTNGDLYLFSQSASLTINGQVTAAGDIYRGRKNTSECTNYPVYIYDPTSSRSLIPSCPGRTRVTQTHIKPYNGMIQMRVPAVTVPGPEVFDPTPGKVYWDKADLRIVLALNSSNAVVGIQVRDADDSNITSASSALNACSGSIGTKAVGYTKTDGNAPFFKNFREGDGTATYIRLLDIDMIALLDCLHSTNWFSTGKKLNDTTDGGLVFHFTVKGPNSSLAKSLYGIRVKNASKLQSTLTTTYKPVGLTLISDQAFYVQGNFNYTSKIPAAIMADSINVLSSNWSTTTDSNSGKDLSYRTAANTTINSAFLSGTDTTGGIEGSGGQGGYYNGGLENYPRFHEDWNPSSGKKTLTYRGSFVSLGKSLHSNGRWSDQSYDPPGRDWNYDTSFNNAANLPPITPRFVYLRQELFVRDFAQ